MTKEHVAEPGQPADSVAGLPAQAYEDVDTRPWQLYLLAAAAAIVTAFVDFVQNVDASAVTKATWGLSRLLDQPPSTLVQVSMLGFFSLVSCVFVFTHRPRKRTHALAIGAGVLTALNLGVSAKTTAPSIGAGTSIGFLDLLIPSAHAEDTLSPAVKPLTKNYVFVEGLLTYGDKAEVVIFDPAGRIVDKRRAGPAFQIDLPPGPYTLLLSQEGHRQVKLDIAVTSEPTAFRMKTRPVPAIQNFLGSREQPPNSDSKLGQLLQSISNDCATNNVADLKPKIEMIPRNDLSRLERSSSRGVQQNLCIAQFRSARPSVN